MDGLFIACLIFGFLSLLFYFSLRFEKKIFNWWINEGVFAFVFQYIVKNIYKQEKQEENCRKFLVCGYALTSILFILIGILGLYDYL